MGGREIAEKQTVGNSSASARGVVGLMEQAKIATVLTAAFRRQAAYGPTCDLSNQLRRVVWTSRPPMQHQCLDKGRYEMQRH